MRTAYSLTKDADEIEDLVETVFEKLYSKYDHVKDHPNILGWLVETLKHQVGSEMQKAYRHREVAMAPEFDSAAPSREEDFMSVLPPGLSESERQILYLHIEAGYSLEEIAAMLGCSPTACRMRYSRARRHCKKLLEENARRLCYIPQSSTNKEDRRCSDV